VLLAHRKKTAAYFSHQFSKRAVEKVYQAKVEGEFLKALTIDNALDGKAAISHVSPLGFDAQKNHSLVSISIETGRKHQIRRHLCAAGYPIVGDRLYGNVATNHAENLALVACFLAFDAPHGGVRKAFELDRQYCPSFED
jgi:tRNA pseudouridine32 synthase/23S rRNA pseudouridine746 synthase